jgi:hypothetical protein
MILAPVRSIAASAGHRGWVTAAFDISKQICRHSRAPSGGDDLVPSKRSIRESGTTRS